REIDASRNVGPDAIELAAELGFGGLRHARGEEREMVSEGFARLGREVFAPFVRGGGGVGVLRESVDKIGERVRLIDEDVRIHENEVAGRGRGKVVDEEIPGVELAAF